MRRNSGRRTPRLFPFVCLFLASPVIAIPVTTNVAAAAGEPPNKPKLISPAVGATVSLTPLLQTDPFEDPDAGDVHAYTKWQISDESDEIVFSKKTDTELISLTVPQGQLKADAVYTWKVRFFDNNGTPDIYQADMKSLEVLGGHGQLG